MNALLSGLSGKGLLLDDDKRYIISLDTPGEMILVSETSFLPFFDDRDNLSFLENVIPEEAMQELQVLYRQQEALDLALMLFDDELSAELRKEAAMALEELLKSADIQSYLKTILYAKPLPVSADKAGALERAAEAGAINVSLFLKALIERQEQVDLARRSWDALPIDVFSDQEEQVKTHAIAVDKGLFLELVESLVTDELDQFQCHAVNALKSITNCNKIVNRWVQGSLSAEATPIHVLLANPRGFCAGVDRTIGIVERALELFGSPIYVLRYEVVPNRFVVDGLQARGAVFVEKLQDVPTGATVIFSAHGVAQTLHWEATERGLKVLDTTCPLVTKVHLEVVRHSRAGREIILIGHLGHPEVEGIVGQYDTSYGGYIHVVETVIDVWKLKVKNPDDLVYITQTTLSMDDTALIVRTLQERFPTIQGPKKHNLCYATQNRQNSVRELAPRCDLLLVIGSPNSFNSNRLREVAQREGIPVYLIEGPEDIDRTWLNGKKVVGLAAGDSAPEVLVRLVVDRLRAIGATVVEENQGEQENMVRTYVRYSI